MRFLPFLLFFVSCQFMEDHPKIEKELETIAEQTAVEIIQHEEQKLVK